MERCVRCIMPASASGISLDKDGVCQLCRDYTAYVPRGEAALRQDIAPFIDASAQYNCVVPVSGGRDSAYALYFAKKVLGLKPMAVHNDNDFETQVATKNLEAITRSMDVPLVRVRSAKKISQKIVAEKFKMNARFGAGRCAAQACEACQYGFETASYNMARQHGIQVIFWGDSRDESTKPYHQLVNKPEPGRLKRFLSPDALYIFTYNYYYNKLKKEYGPRTAEGLKEIHLYDYIRWDQKVIVDTIEEKMGWSVPDNSPTTWRVDCSLVPLINYLTEVAYGVSKIELGFSNMVRSGKMDRDDALRRVAMIAKNTDISQLRGFLSDMNISASMIDKMLSAGIR